MGFKTHSKDIKSDLLSALTNSKLDDYEGKSLRSKPDDDKLNGFMDMVKSPILKSKSSDYSHDSEAKPATFKGSKGQGRFCLSSSISIGTFQQKLR